MKKFTQLLEKKRSYSDYVEQKYDDPNKNIIYNYVLGLISGINDNLRKNDVKTDANIVQQLDDAFTSDLAEHNVVDVYRTVDWNYMKSVHKITKNNINDFIGKQLTNKGFMSTTSIKKSPWMDKWSDDECIMHIVSDNPINYIDVNKIFNENEIDSYYQHEILLPRNLTLEFMSYSEYENTIIFEMKIV